MLLRSPNLEPLQLMATGGVVDAVSPASGGAALKAD